MKTGIFTLLLCSSLFVFGQQSVTEPVTLNENNTKEIQFYLKKTANDDQKILYYRIGEKGKEELLFDPNGYKDEKGNVVLIKSFSPNKQGTKVCLAVGSKKSEKAKLYIVDVQSKQLHKEQINNCMNHKVTWMDDGRSFVYCQQYVDLSEDGRIMGDLFIHRVGTDSSEDDLVTFTENRPEHY